MAKAKQLILSVPDEPGMLGEIAAALGAKKVFAQRGWQVKEEEVLAVSLADSPGSLGRLASKLGRAGVNITSIYAGSAGRARKLNAYMTVSDLKAAQKAAR